MTTKPNLNFDHKAGPQAECPSEKCADRSRRLAWVNRFTDSAIGPFETLNIEIDGLHVALIKARSGRGEVTIHMPSDELLQSLVMACMGEIERRQELRDQQNAPAECNCYSGGKDDCPVHKAECACGRCAFIAERSGLRCGTPRHLHEVHALQHNWRGDSSACPLHGEAVN